MDPTRFDDRAPVSGQLLRARAAAEAMHRRRAARGDVFAALLAVAVSSCLVVTAFLFGRWSATAQTVVPAPKVYVVGPQPSTTTTTAPTSSSVP